MTQRLTNLEITRVSLVDKGANQKRLAVLKRDEEGPMTDPAGPDAPAGVVAWLRKQLGLAEPVAKGPMTFADIVAGQELQDALWDNWYTLEDALWSALYAYDANGQPLSMEAKQALVAQNLDEFKAYLIDQMASVVSKGETPPPTSSRIASLVAKVGKKISGSRLERLQAAAEALTSVLDEVAEAVTDEAASAEEVPVDKAELIEAMTEVITKAQEPIVKRLDAIEGKKVVKTEPDPEGEEGDAGDEALTLEGLATVVEKILDRLDGVAQTEGVRKSLAGQDGGSEPVKKSVFAGILG